MGGGDEALDSNASWNHHSNHYRMLDTREVLKKVSIFAQGGEQMTAKELLERFTAEELARAWISYIKHDLWDECSPAGRRANENYIQLIRQGYSNSDASIIAPIQTALELETEGANDN